METKTERTLKDITGCILAGGGMSRNSFSRLLGLNELKSSGQMKALAWVNDHIECSLEVEKDREIIFLFEKFQRKEKNSFFNTKHLTIRCRGKELPRDLTELIVRKFSGKWGNLTLEKMASLLMSDPELGKPGLPTPSHADKFRTSRSFLDTWGMEGVYADFVARGEFERSQLDSIDFFNHCTNIQHSDLECSTVIANGPSMHLIDFPWIDAMAQKGGKDGESQQPETEPDSKKGDQDNLNMMLMTDLTEKDVIMGSNKKVKDVLDYVVSKNPDKMIFFSNTCVPITTGEDVESVVKQYQKISPTPLIYLTCTAQSMNNVFRSLLVERRLKAEESITQSDPKKINLIGFQNDAPKEELVRILREISIEVNVQLLPTLHFKDIDALPLASLNVYYPNNLWQHLYNQLLLGSKIKYIFPEAPYGLLRTKKWFEDIISTLGISMDFNATWGKHVQSIEEQWLTLMRDAENHRLGICLRSDELHYLLDPSQLWGVPLACVLEEMGFGLDIMIKMDKGEDREFYFSHVKALLKTPEKHLFDSFHDFTSLRNILSSSEADAIFSNHFFDWRLTEARKNRFSLRHFEKGITGALKTVKTLLQICKTPFYRRYGRYLRRTPGGLRMAESSGNNVLSSGVF